MIRAADEDADLDAEEVTRETERFGCITVTFERGKHKFRKAPKRVKTKPDANV